MLKKGGAYRFNLNSLAKQNVYDGDLNSPPERIAGEYQHGVFTAGNSFNPLFSTGQVEALAKNKTGVGDFLGLFVIPTEHTLIDVAAKVVPHQKKRGMPSQFNSDGLVFTLEARKYDASTGKQTGSVEFVDDMSSLTASAAMMKRSSVKPGEGGYFIPDNEIVVLGLKVEAVPNDKNVTLADVTCRVEVTAHVYDYEAPMHM